MNDQTIEHLLRKTPPPQAPADLAAQLVANIRLPRADYHAPRPFISRWLPALSFAAILLTCAIVLGVQNSRLRELLHENEDLRGQSQNLDSLRQANADVQRLRLENGELEQLQKDAAEFRRLGGEVARLKTQAAGLAKLRAENQTLLAASRAAPDAPEDVFAEAKAKAERIQCANNLKQISLAARIWASDNNDVYPSNFICMTNEMGTWKITQCPSDTAHNVSGWADVAAGNISYLMLNPESQEKDNPMLVDFECPVHRIVALHDGSVQSLNAETYALHIKMVDGRKVYQR